MSQNFNCTRYIYAATDKKTGEFMGYWRMDPAYSPVALTTSVWRAEFTLNIKVARGTIDLLRENAPAYNWKIQEVVMTVPKDVE